MQTPMSWRSENPSPQLRNRQYVIDMSENGYQTAVVRVFNKFGVSQHSIYSILELGCGAGAMTHALVQVCSSLRTLHAVDYGNVLQIDLFNPQVVIPIVGLISSVIEQPPISQFTYDFVVCCTMSAQHGLGKWQLQVLAQRLHSNGHLFTIGDNGTLINNDFHKLFITSTYGKYDDDAVLWSKK